MTNKFEEHACEFKNEAACEEELEETDTAYGAVERDFYGDKD